MHSNSAAHSGDRIRILYLIPSFRTGGAEVQLLSLVRGLDKSRFDVTVAAFYEGGDLDASFEETPDIDVVYLQKKGGFDFTFLRRLISLIRRRKFQIVQSYNVSARFFGILVAKLMRTPAAIATERTARLLYSSMGSRVYLFLEKQALRSADLVIANSRAGQKFATSRGAAAHKTVVVYNGIDSERITARKRPQDVRRSLGIPATAFVVGMAARVERIKDPFTLVEAARQVLEDAADVRFLLVGDGPLLADVKTEIDALGLKDRFICTGRRSDAADFINIMDVVVLTSHRVEGCSNSLLEAMWLGKPVVATRVGGNVEVVHHQENGLLIPPQRPDELAASVFKLHADASLRQRLGRQAAEDARSRFSQSVMVRRHEEIYKSLLAHSAFTEKDNDEKFGLATSNERPFPRSNVLGCPVDRMTLDQCVAHFEKIIRRGEHCHIVVVNAAKVVKARRDAELREVIEKADLVGADGVPIVWASRLLGQPLPGRVNGTDLMNKLFEMSAQKGWRLYLLGARPRVIKDAVENLRRRYPTINIAGYRHGYFDSIADEVRAVAEINAVRPDILLLGFGTPMKEKWVKRHKQTLHVPIIHGVGGSFDIVGGLTKRAPLWMQRAGLEWLFRLIQEPGRMWRRYLVTNTTFIWLVTRAWARQAIYKK